MFYIELMGGEYLTYFDLQSLHGSTRSIHGQGVRTVLSGTTEDPAYEFVDPVHLVEG